MIWHPHPGDRVKIVYARRVPPSLKRLVGVATAARILAVVTRLADCTGTVEHVGRGPGPVNVEMLLDPAEGQIRVTVPRGNLIEEDAP